MKSKTIFIVSMIIFFGVGCLLGRELTRDNWFSEYDCRHISFFYSDFLVKKYNLRSIPNDPTNIKQQQMEKKFSELKDSMWKLCNTDLSS